MKPAIVIVDMLKDSIKAKDYASEEYLEIVPKINNLLGHARKMNIPVIFACDSFMKDDFIFKGSSRQYNLRGTKGAEVMDELDLREGDQILPKRRFSSFFKTDLDQTLHLFGVDTVVVTGINTHVCVLATAMDSVCNDFYTIVLEDCSAAYKKEVHQGGIEVLRQSRLKPLLRVMSSEEFLEEAAGRDI